MNSLTYSVDGKGFDSFLDAVEAAQATRSNVIQTSNGAIRWTPAPIRTPKARHVIVNADGSTTRFRKVSSHG